jgi:hypothetical protein
MKAETKKLNKAQRLATIALAGYVFVFLVMHTLSEFTPLNLPEVDYIGLIVIPLFVVHPILGSFRLISNRTFRKISIVYAIVVWILLILLNIFKLFSLSFPFQKLVYFLVILVLTLSLYLVLNSVNTYYKTPINKNKPS